jgi:hypothetical protein
MKKGLYLWLSTLILTTASGALLAQGYDYHPLLSDSFTASLGAMRSSNSFKVEADTPGDPGTFVDFDDSLGVSHNSTFFNGQLRWKFGREKKWNLQGQYFSNNAKGSTVLTEDVEWDGLTFGEGTFVDSGVKLGVSRLVIGRSFIKNARNDFGIGVGIHNLDIDVFIEGEIIVDDETTEIQRGELSVSQILPNIGGWYNFSPGKNWLIHARVDWISADINGYGGHMWNTAVGVNYQAFRHVGFDLYWQYFNLQIRADKTDWRGRADMTYSGPVLAVTFNW